MRKVLYLLLFSFIFFFARLSGASENLIISGLGNLHFTTDTIIPVTRDTLQQVLPADTQQVETPLITGPDTITEIPVSDTLETEIAKPAEPATIHRDVEKRSEEVVAPPVTIRQIRSFDQQMVFSVVWDSLMIKNDTIIISRVYPAQAKFGAHELQVHEMRVESYDTERTSPEIFTLLIIINLIMIGLANYFFPQRLREMIMAAWEPRIYFQLEREGGIMAHWVSFFLYFNFLLVLTMLVYQLFDFFGLEETLQQIPSSLLMGYIFIAMVSFYFAKYLLLVFIAWVFKRQESSQTYFRNILIMNNFSGLVILPAMIIYTFNPSAWIIYGSLGLLLFLNVYKIGRGAIVGHQRTGFSAYYLILYLCAIEIAPVLLIIKITMNYLTG
jgi:hypothetical protein